MGKINKKKKKQNGDEESIMVYICNIGTEEIGKRIISSRTLWLTQWGTISHTHAGVHTHSHKWNTSYKKRTSKLTGNASENIWAQYKFNIDVSNINCMTRLETIIMIWRLIKCIYNQNNWSGKLSLAQRIYNVALLKLTCWRKEITIRRSFKKKTNQWISSFSLFFLFVSIPTITHFCLPLEQKHIPGCLRDQPYSWV